jgi:ribonuclease HI
MSDKKFKSSIIPEAINTLTMLTNINSLSLGNSPIKQKINIKTIKLTPIIPLQPSEYTLNFDGASRGNPGPSGIGAVIFYKGQEIWASCQYIGNKTNNQSEYSALILGLKKALSCGITSLTVYGDSLLVINQTTGKYKVKNILLQELNKEVQCLKAQFEYIEFIHVYREFNKRADQLSNMALDQPIEKFGINENKNENEADESENYESPRNNFNNNNNNCNNNITDYDEYTEKCEILLLSSLL